MKILLILSILSLLGCTNNRNYQQKIIGDWSGAYDGDTVNVSFDSTKFSVHYLKGGGKYSYDYHLKNDSLFIDNSLFGILELLNKSLAFDLINDTARDIELIYIIKFNKIQ